MRSKVPLGCIVPLLPFGLVFGIGLIVNLRQRPALSADEQSFLTAARRGDLEGLRAALFKGVNVDVVEPAFGRTALMRAAAFDRLDAVKLLLASGADTRKSDRERYTVLHIASEANAADVIAVLPITSADQTALCINRTAGSTPLGLAVRAGHLEAVRALLAAHANPSYVEPGDRSLLEQAIEKHDVEMVRSLVTAGASLAPSPGSSAVSMLHLAVRDCAVARIEMVKALVDAGADRTVRDREGRTPLEFIRTRDAAHQTLDCYPPIAKYLESGGR